MKKVISLLLVMVLLGSASACGTKQAQDTADDGQKTEQKQETAKGGESSGADAADTAGEDAGKTDENPWSHLDLSEYAEVNFFFPGNKPEDFDEVAAMANELMLEKINTKVNFTIVSYGEYANKLSLFLAGDEDVDLIYGASWLGYTDYVKSGAYKSFDWDFVQTYMPLSAKNQAQSSWKEVEFDGLYYGITNNRCDVGWNGAWTTQALLDKYGYKAEEIDSYEKLIEYLDQVAADAPSTGVYPINPQGDYPMDAFHWFTTRYHLMDVNAGAANWMVWPYNTGKEFAVEDLKWFAETDEYRQFCLQMADFYKKGYFPASVISNSTLLDDNFINGTSAIVNAGPSNLNNLTVNMPNETPVFLNCYWDDECVTRRGNYFIYATCFPATAENSERAAVALDCMKFDPQVHSLLLGGVEGRHYTLDEENNTYEPGPDALKYPWGNWSNNGAINNDSDPKLKMDDEMQAYQDMYEAALVPSEIFPVNGFNYNSAEYEAELSAATALANEYRFSFCFGLFGDQTQEKLDEFIAQCKAVGIDDVCEDYRKQLAAYMAQ